MKTFTNLSHWALKKCASLGTTNRNRYYLFSIIMLLTLGVGNAWGAEETESYTCAKGTIVDNSMTWNLTSCTIEHEKAESSNELAAYGPWRIYAKQTITITPKSGITITKMVITSTSEAYATAGTKTWTNATATSNSTSITVIPTDGTSKFVYTNTNSGQTRWQSVVITYTSGGTEPPTPAKTYDVTWMVNGEEWAISEDVEENTQITTLPIEPTDECAGKVFQGWTDKEITDGQKPAVLFKDKSPEITDDLTFYAVFATVPAGGGTGGSITISSETENFPTAYGTANAFTEYTLEGYKFKIQQVYINGGKLQWRASGNKSGTGTMYNTQKFPANIASIVVVFDASDSNKNHTVKVGATENPTSGTSISPSISGSTYTFDCSGGSYDYFVLTNGANAGYVSSITINYGSVATPSDYTTSCSGSTEPALSTTPTEIDFGTVYEGATVADKTVAVNFANLTGNVTYSGLSTPFTATGAISATGDKITISADASTIGEYSQTLTITSAADSKTAEVTVKMNVVEKPAPTGTFTLHTGALVEGDYVIVSTNSLKAEVNSDRLASLPVTISNDEIVDPDATTIWHIAKSGEYWTLYNANKAKYAASTGAKNKAALLDDGSDDKALWSVTGTSTYEFVNKKNAASALNANLRYNKDNAENSRWACYSTSTGAALSLYRKAGTKYNVNISATTNGTVTASPTSAEAGTIIALTVTPDAGYVLDALTVTDASSNTVTVTNNEFTMPASNVTVTATFKEIPAATLTLSKNEDTSEKIVGKVGDVINLPDFTSDCSKTFVGWDSKSDCTDAPEYKAGESYTLAAETQTLYAVYADVVEGASVNVFSETFDACEGKGANGDEAWSGTGIAAATLTLDGWTCEKGNAANGCAKFGASSAKGSAETPAIAITGNATLSFRAGAWDNAAEVTTLNLSATGANLSQSSITLTKAAWTEYTIHITEATGSVKIKFEASVKDKNRFFLDDVVVSQASVTYSEYSTTCAAALDAPTFTPVPDTYNEVTYVTISATDGEVYYTLDGTTPTKESNKYTAPIVLNTNGTTTIKAIAISGESQSSVVTATYTIELPLTTMDEIFAAATTAGGAEAPVLIKMNNWVVSAVKEDGKTAYLTDGTKGLIIYTASHGFDVGDILSGTVACKVQLFKGSAELTELTATTEGLTITKGGTVSTVVVDDVTTLSGVNTGSVIKINGVHESDNIVNNVKLYNTLFSFENLTPGQEYNVTGVYLQYEATKEILPRSAADIEEVVGLPTATISIENITLVEGDEHTIVATITPDEAASKVTYSIKNGDEYISLSGNVITANAVGTATITAAIAEVDGVYHGTTKDFTVTVKEYVAPISGTWELVTDASKLQAGMEVIVAQYVEADGTIYTMGGQKTNNRDVVESSVLGETLTPTTGTAVLTLVDAGNGTFALQAGNEKYLYAASNTSNHLKETATINDNDDAKWSISVTEGKASVVAQGSNSHNTIRFNKSNNPKIFSCYESGHQQDIALYARVPDHIREVPVGYFATICVPNNIVKVVGATLYKVAGKENGKLYFDEVLVEETEEGMPYVFFTDAATQEFYYGSETTDIAGKENSLQGTFEKLEDEDLKDHYMLQSNKIIKCADTGCWIDPYRAYFDGNDLSGLGKPSAQMPDRRRVSMGAEEENETTGTEDVVAPEGQTLKHIENGQLIIIRNGEKFNAQGVRF